MKPIQIRQGDVYLIPVAKLPAGCTPIQPEGGRRFVLAHGEVTGHAHAIYEFTPDEAASPPTIPAGIYHAPIQVEAGADNMLRRVAD